MILDNYAKCIQAINELEHNLNEDQLKKQSDLLKREVEKLQREIKNLQNDNEKLVSSVSHVRMLSLLLILFSLFLRNNYFVVHLSFTELLDLILVLTPTFYMPILGCMKVYH